MKKNLYVVFLLMAMSTLAMGQLPSYVPTDGLYAWYSFTGNADDVSGNAHHGTITGAVPGLDRYGNSDAAYSFDGNGNVIELAGSDTFSGAAGFTLSAWVYCPLNLTGAVITKHVNGTQNGFTLGTSSNFAVMAINNGSPNTVFSPLAYNDTSWHFFIGRYDGDTMDLFVDTALVATLTGVTPPNGNAMNILIGKESLYSPFTGLIDEAGIWSRALSDEEITQLYHPALIGVEEVSKNISRIFPNPATTHIVIETPSASLNNELTLTITNMLNQEIHSRPVDQLSEVVDINHLDAGIYFVRITDNAGSFQFQKVIVD